MASSKTSKAAGKPLSEPIQLWLEALRSGKYKWTIGRLHANADVAKIKDIPEGFCCLGVLCEVAIKQGVISGYWPGNGTLPAKVREWAGLEAGDGSFLEDADRANSLAEINDSASRNPFKRIANLIEKQPDGLFEAKP